MKTISILGAGKVGKVLGRQFVLHQVFQVKQVMNRSTESAREAIAFMGAGVAAGSIADLGKTDIYMLTVSDDQIAATCRALAERGLLDASSMVFHCSGAKASSELQAAIDAGAAVASLHPVRSFADTAQVSADFAGTICSVEGDRRALQVLLPALTSLQTKAVEISAESKLLYHAGSVFASNYLVSLMDTALQAYVAAGIPLELAKAMAQPLAMQSLDNVFRLGAAAALTGPIARGDMELVEKQQRAVATWDVQAGELYRSFIGPTVKLAEKKRTG